MPMFVEPENWKEEYQHAIGWNILVLGGSLKVSDFIWNYIFQSVDFLTYRDGKLDTPYQTGEEHRNQIFSYGVTSSSTSLPLPGILYHQRNHFKHLRYWRSHYPSTHQCPTWRNWFGHWAFHWPICFGTSLGLTSRVKIVLYWNGSLYNFPAERLSCLHSVYLSDKQRCCH